MKTKKERKPKKKTKLIIEKKVKNRNTRKLNNN